MFDGSIRPSIAPYMFSWCLPFRKFEKEKIVVYAYASDLWILAKLRRWRRRRRRRRQGLLFVGNVCICTYSERRRRRRRRRELFMLSFVVFRFSFIKLPFQIDDVNELVVSLSRGRWFFFRFSFFVFCFLFFDFRLLLLIDSSVRWELS